MHEQFPPLLLGLRFGRARAGTQLLLGLPGLDLAVCGEGLPGGGVLELAELLRQLYGLHHHPLHLVVITHLKFQFNSIQ